MYVFIYLFIYLFIIDFHAATSPNCPSPSISTNLRFLRGNSKAERSTGGGGGAGVGDGLASSRSAVAYGLTTLDSSGSHAELRGAKSFESFTSPLYAGVCSDWL